MTVIDLTLEHCPGCGAELTGQHSCTYTRTWSLPGNAQVLISAHLTELANAQ
jgi:hypothetical protein